MKKRLRHAKTNKQPRPPERAARRDYVHELEFELRSYREVNECYRQALVRAETTIHLKEEQKNMWWRHLQAERGQSCALRVTIRELQKQKRSPSGRGFECAYVHGSRLHGSAGRCGRLLHSGPLGRNP